MSGGTYTTIQGDMWDSISFKALGSTEFVDRIMALNTQYIGYYVFPAGIVIQLPIITPGDSVTSLPPWKMPQG